MLVEELERQKKLLEEVYKANRRLRKVPFEDLAKAHEQGKLLFIEGLKKPAFRFKREFRGFLAGTVVGPHFFMPGFPSIPRVFVLETGIPRYLRGPFYAEEKIEGYNVRLAKVFGEIKAFTRRGYVCPFATDRYLDFLPRLPEFFEKYPQLVVCCEVAGPENPFVSEWPPYVKEDVLFFVFDLFDLEKETFLPPEEKYKLLQAYEFRTPEINGPYQPDDISSLKKLILHYDEEGREGIVIKPASLRYGRVIKYVTSASNVSDLRVAFPYIGELDASYIVHRLVRIAITRWELGQPFDEAFSKELGSALFGEIKKLLDGVSQGEPVEEVFRVRLKHKEALHALLAHFRTAQVRIEIRREEWKDGYLHVEFAKIYPRATSFWAGKLQGLAQID
ncbi:RNA ligase [Thermodesulfatator atlanticus]|uniref:RNA ligase n=1 Tax=Thermodesulfatator atlanticus TaxID=501497 RepID=UPI0003B6B0F3|nr:RNA ligase [Thermodesulfatator atlanticus]